MWTEEKLDEIGAGLECTSDNNREHFQQLL
jgi:hypothetical protein